MRVDWLASIEKEGFERLPPKIWRATMLWLHGLPVTDYLILDLVKLSRNLAISQLKKELERSRYGIVIRTVTRGGGNYQPYYWVREVPELPRVFGRIESHGYLIAFAPQALPESAKGFTVGRYLIMADGSRRIEYCQDQIQPRILERVTMKTEKYGILVQEIGHLFRSFRVTNPALATGILSRALSYEEQISLLWRTLEGKHPTLKALSLEFTFNGSSIEIHDFDFASHFGSFG